MVVDDHHMTRLGLVTFAQTANSKPVNWLEAGSLSEALENYRGYDHIDLVLLDLNLPDSQGLKSVQLFLAEYPAAKIAIYSASEDEFVVHQATALGVIGFIPKSSSPDSMLVLLESLLSNTRQDDPVSDLSIGANTNPGNAHSYPRPTGLNPTQLKVLELVLSGLSNQEIATECGLALGTVKNTVSFVMLSLHVNSRSHLISLFR
jgi:DNA-binding NarL/FixJ family response regulator